METGIITFTLILIRSFFHSLRNCWPFCAVHKCETITCLIYTPLRMYRGIGVEAYSTVTGTLLMIMS